MALPWLIKDAIDTTLYKADSSVSLLRYPLLILGAAVLLALTLGLAIVLSSRKAQQVAEQKILEDLKDVPAIWSG